MSEDTETPPGDIETPLGVCVLPEPARNVGRGVQHADYIFEILDHAGLCYAGVTVERLAARLPSLRLLLTVGEAALPDTLRQALAAWVREGGAWLSIGGVCGMEETLGVAPVSPAYAGWGGGVRSLGEGYLHPSSAHPAVASVPLPLHFFGGVAVSAAGAVTLATTSNAHQHPGAPVALTEHRTGQGVALLLAPDLTGTIVRIQQGVSVTRDGVSAPDGTAPVADGVLKSDDGAALDWIFDRQPVPGVPGLQAFLQPIADHWRALLLRALFSLAARRRVPLPLLWFYPDNRRALAHLSHDTDGNAPEAGYRLLELLREMEIRSTWCVIAPGYGPELIAAIRDAGHELAMHYDAMSEGTRWSQAEFARQWTELTALFSGQRPLTNKNHYLRWEGDTEFYRWCEATGIALDQSKGASKTGEAGFNFGTCHPGFPVAADGTRPNVLALATPTQDLEVFAPAALLEPLLEAVLRHYGVLHLLFHPAHIFKPEVAEALRRAAAQAKQRGLEFWTAARLNRWERARRLAVWRHCVLTETGATVRLQTPEALSGATILWLSGEPGTATVNGQAQRTETVERWGFAFQAVPFDAAAGGESTLHFQPAVGEGPRLRHA